MNLQIFLMGGNEIILIMQMSVIVIMETQENDLSLLMQIEDSIQIT
jgi:hypothetical protein